jgi:two-component system NtrC family sensor kinase
MIGRLAAGVAHEINNPLGSILLFSRLLLQRTPSDDLQRENLERIERETRRCQNIVQGLLDFARQRKPKVEAVQINDILDKAIQLFDNQPMFHNIDLVKDYQPDLPIISVDPSLILQVFTNIIINAVDAMKDSGVLTIRTLHVESPQRIEISFSDTGPGIPSNELDKVFEPFYTTKEVGRGTGLGLSVSYGIIEGHGGTMRVQSRVTKGTTFIVLLPVTEEKV